MCKRLKGFRKKSRKRDGRDELFTERDGEELEVSGLRREVDGGSRFFYSKMHIIKLK